MTKIRVPRRKDPTPAQAKKREERAAQVNDLSRRLAAFAASTDPAQRAEYEARFDHYSPRNAMLIALQAPHATVVRGYKAWLTEGRQVRRGEHGIEILAYAGSIGGPAEEQTLQPGETSEGQERAFFRPIHVFDLSQTEPIDSPTPVTT